MKKHALRELSDSELTVVSGGAGAPDLGALLAKLEDALGIDLENLNLEDLLGQLINN